MIFKWMKLRREPTMIKNDNYEGPERREETNIILWVVGIIFLAGGFYFVAQGQLRTLNDQTGKNSEMLSQHERKIAVLENDILYIKDGVKEILGRMDGRKH